MRLKKKLLAKAELEALLIGVNFKTRMLKDEVNDLLEKETRMWFQRSHSRVLLQATKNKTYTPKNICSSVSKDRSHGEYPAQFYAT